MLDMLFRSGIEVVIWALGIMGESDSSKTIPFTSFTNHDWRGGGAFLIPMVLGAIPKLINLCAW